MKPIMTAIAIMTTGAVLSAAIPANATPLMRTVYCADGSVFKVGDELTDAQVCAQHGGVKKNKGIVGKIKANTGTIPPIPKRTTNRVTR